MTLNLAKKRIAVVGLGLSGLATVRFLLNAGIRPVLMDSRSKPAGIEQIAPEKVDGIYLGELDANRLAKMDMIVLSPGLSPTHPAIRFALAQGTELVGDVELFARVNNKPVIAITGSNGKSTVTKLVEAMLNASGINALAAGNIGLPVLDAIARPGVDVFVLELSSFQLDTTRSLHSIASCILNVSADHLDRYRDLAAYAASKQRVYQQTQLAVFNLADSATTPEQAGHTLGISLADSAYGIVHLADTAWLQVAGEPLLPVAQMTLFGAHNQFNALVACALAADARYLRACEFGLQLRDDPACNVFLQVVAVLGRTLETTTPEHLPSVCICQLYIHTYQIAHGPNAAQNGVLHLKLFCDFAQTGFRMLKHLCGCL